MHLWQMKPAKINKRSNSQAEKEVNPAKRITRSISQAERQAKLLHESQQVVHTVSSIVEESSSETQNKKMESKRQYAINQFNRLKTAIEDEAIFATWSKGDLGERIKRLDELNTNLDNFNMHLTCDDKLSSEQTTENDTIDDEIMSLKGKLHNRIDELGKQSDSQAMNVQAANEKFRIEVQHTDAAGNIPSTWGTFNGDYSQWQSFRDRWVAAMHSNEKIKPVIKFQNLKTACTGDAAGTLGDWDLTDENYQKAWEKLTSVYEDDYMQIQAFMRKLNKLPHMKNRSSKTIRSVIETVQKHINGLKRYIKIDEAQLYAVFTVIDRMDTTTYSAWEKHRLTLANNQANNQA